MDYIGSDYNFLIDLEDDRELFLFNSLYGSLIHVPRLLKSPIKELINSCFNFNSIPSYLRKLILFLEKGGFIKTKHSKELNKIKKRYNNPPEPRVFSLTIAPTLDCNLRCIYCYQKRKKIRMNQNVCKDIIKEVKRRIIKQGIKGIKVDWYGGEPLLELNLIETLSKSFISLAKNYKITYEASITTNGTLLNTTSVDILSNFCVSEVQITIDGPPHIHNANRPYINGDPSFNDILRGVKSTANRIPVVLRINVDRNSIKKIFDFLDVLEEFGIFDKNMNLHPYIAMIGPLTSNCLNTCSKVIKPKDWYDYVLKFQKKLIDKLKHIDPKEILDYPKILTKPCAAVSEFSICVHPSGRVYKCGLEIDNPNKGGGMIWERYWKHPNYKYWVKYNPFKRKKCCNCKYLPLCMGGCLRHTFSTGDFYEGNACFYWSNYLKTVLKQYIKNTYL